MFISRPAAGSRTIIGAADVDALAYDDVARVFEVELAAAGGEFLALEPGVNHPNLMNPVASYPPSAAGLQPGDVMRLFERTFEVGGFTDDLFYWNGVGSVLFTPASADFRIDGGDPLGSVAGVGGAFDDHPFLVVDSDGMPGIYLASVVGRVDGFDDSAPAYLVMATGEEFEEAHEAAAEFVQNHLVVPEPATFGLAIVGCAAVGFAIRRRRVNMDTRRHGIPMVLAAGFLGVVPSANAMAAQDVMLQVVDGRIVTGAVDDSSGSGVLGARVFGGHFQLVGGTFRSSNPGFFGLRTGDVAMLAEAIGFPAEHDVSFDLLPMAIGFLSSNLLFWDGSDVDGGGVGLNDVNFVSPTDVSWDVFDPSFIPTSASGTDAFVPGGLIDQTSADVWPDGIDSGTIHRHLALQVRDHDSNSATTPAAGVYMIALQARSAGFETSEPFLFVHRSPTVADSIRDVAVAWAVENIAALTGSPAMTGDYNEDGTVDAADYVMWRKTDRGGAIGYAEFVSRFGSSSPGQGATVAPEPGMPAVMVLGLIFFAVDRRLYGRVARNSGAIDYTRQHLQPI